MTKIFTDETGAPVDAASYGAAFNISFTGTAANSSVFTDLGLIRIVATENCYVKVGVSAVAANTDTYLPAGFVETVRVKNGERISVIRASADGILNVTNWN